MLHSLKNLKKAFFLFCFSLATNTVFSQTSYHVLEGNTFNDAVYKNVKEGKPQFEGMSDLYTIKTDNMKPVKSDNQGFTNKIKSISGVISCSYDLSNSIISVVFVKPTNKDFYANDTHLAALKAELASMDMKMLESKLSVIKQ